MPFRLNDYECPQGHVTEHFIHTDNMADPVLCPACSEVSVKLIGAPTIDPRLGLDPDGFPTMGAKWAAKRYQRAAIEAKQNGA